MQYSALCVLLLAVSEPLFIHAKMVLVVPRQVRRTPSWKPSPPYYKKNYGSNDFRHAYYSPAHRYYSKKPFRPLPYGDDDFDHGHQTANNVHVPYGKDVTHSVSFGKGYIPYDNIKSSNLPFVPDRYAGAYTRQPVAPDYPPTGFTSVGQEYSASATAHSYESPQHDSFFSDVEGASLKENANKYYASRSIEKDLTLKNQQALSSAIERDKDSKGVEGQPKDTPPNVYSHIITATDPTEGAVILPAGIPEATIAGNKNGIVLRDTVSMDEYHRKLQELTKTWPNVLPAGAYGDRLTAYGGAIPASHQQLHADFTVTGLPGSAGFAGPTGGGWLTNFAQSKQSYAVREDHGGDTTSYDFRTMPIHTVPYQHLPFGVPTGAAAIAPHHHG